jgi:nucleotidyltransferase/DNA polymerase involved in DNA repair
MHAQFLRERHNVLAALQPLHRHPAELVRITSHSFLCHLQFLSLHSVPFPSVSFWGFSSPDGLFVIRPEDVEAFLLALPVGRLPGVGKVTGENLANLGVETVEDLRKLDLPALEENFGRYGVRLHELARGIDESVVIPDRPTQSISVEDTFEHEVPLSETEPMIRRLAEKLWSDSRQDPGLPARWSSN